MTFHATSKSTPALTTPSSMTGAVRPPKTPGGGRWRSSKSIWDVGSRIPSCGDLLSFVLYLGPRKARHQGRTGRRNSWRGWRGVPGPAVFRRDCLLRRRFLPDRGMGLDARRGDIGKDLFHRPFRRDGIRTPFRRSGGDTARSLRCAATRTARPAQDSTLVPHRLTRPHIRRLPDPRRRHTAAFLADHRLAVVEPDLLLQQCLLWTGVLHSQPRTHVPARCRTTGQATARARTRARKIPRLTLETARRGT